MVKLNALIKMLLKLAKPFSLVQDYLSSIGPLHSTIGSSNTLSFHMVIVQKLLMKKSQARNPTSPNSVTLEVASMPTIPTRKMVNSLSRMQSQANF